MIYKRGCDKKGPNSTCSKCGDRGACGAYSFKFLHDGKLIRKSTGQRNLKIARQMESARRTKLADESRQRKEKAIELACSTKEVTRCTECEKWFNLSNAVANAKNETFCGDQCLRASAKRRAPMPTLADFINLRFEPWVKSKFEKTSPKTWLDYYRVGLRNIKAYEPLSRVKLDQINSETVTSFTAHRHANGLQISTINSSLRVLRRVLRVAVEWGALEVSTKIKMLPGERHRERVVTPEDEARYLAFAPEPLLSVATVLIDTGLRPEEAFRLRWDVIGWHNGRHGTLLVTHGKTAAARRVLPMTPKVRYVLEARWEGAGKPDEGWVWPAPTKTGHLESSSLKKRHVRVFEELAEDAKKGGGKSVRRFVLYSLRHTFLTRLGESGCDVWTLARIAGHSSIKMSSRYVHPSENAVLDAMARFEGGHKIGHSADQLQLPINQQQHVTHS
jgi:integrase